MDFFNTYTSNSLAGSGNQYRFFSDPQEICTGRAYYRIHQGGSFHYSLLFSNILDSTYEDASIGHCNLILEPWQLISARVGRCPYNAIGGEFSEPEQIAAIDAATQDLQPLTFGGKPGKDVAPGEFFTSDPILLHFEKDEYLCVELTFRGSELPYHEESLLPIFRQTEDGWAYDRRMPLPAMIGCDRPVRRKVAFVGDSITQGCGTPLNGYLWWNAVLANKFPDDLAFWNLGLGYGRAADLASGGAWLHKAQQNDVVILCYGVNDLQRYGSAEILIYHLETILNYLELAGKTVVLQTIPPFEYQEHVIPHWERVNAYIHEVLSKRVAAVFDVATYIGKKDTPHEDLYGPHPDVEGCRVWAEALYRLLTSEGIL